MTTPNPYAYLVPIAMKYFRDQEAAERAARKPRLTLITTNERTSDMETTKPKKNDMSAQETSPVKNVCLMANGEPLAEHGALNDLDAAAWMLVQGANALKCIGQMIQPQTTEDMREGISATHEEMSHLFNFFGDALRGYSTTVNEASWRIAQAARGLSER